MTPLSIWNTEIHLVAHSFHSDLDSFRLPVDTYKCWAWLALETGRIWFKMGAGRDVLEGHCGAGDWILCPPDTPLRRRMIVPSSFHIARLEAPGEALLDMKGVGTLRDSLRLRANFAALRQANWQEEAQQWKAHVLSDMLCCARWERLGSNPPASSDTAMNEIRSVLEAQFARNISMAALSRQCRCSPATFCKRFRAAHGVAPQEFLLQKRLDAVRSLLLESDLTLDAIAHECGFATGFYLSRLWKKRFGLAPAHFRRLHRA